MLYLLATTANAKPIDFYVNTVYKGVGEGAVSVFLFKADSELSWGNYFKKSITDKTGRAQFSVEEGKYYIFARKEEKDKLLFGFYGLNPVNIRTDQSINITLLKYEGEFAKSIKSGKLEGYVYFDDKPVANLSVYIYLDLSSELKGPPYLYALTDDKGYFSVDISEGSYYLVFRKRYGSQFGPPSSGDLIGFFPIMPLIIKKGGYKITAHAFKIPEKRDLSENRNLFKIKGRVLLKDGRAATDYYVGLYDNRELLGKPIFVSNPSDSNGEFTIFVKESGEYYVGIRKRLGDTPEADEELYFYDKLVIDRDYKEKLIEIMLD